VEPRRRPCRRERRDDATPDPRERAATTELFLDGVSQGSLAVADPFTWDEEKAMIVFGLSCVGLMDEFAVFDRSLSPEGDAAMQSSGPLGDLLDPR
jgi:hypothetical protein